MPKAGLLCVESYPGADVGSIAQELARRLAPAEMIDVRELYRPATELRELFASYLTDDRVFGRMNGFTIADYFADGVLEVARDRVEAATSGALTLVIGPGASLLARPGAVLVYADMARWEIQLRFRSSRLGNLGMANETGDFASKYKCGYFLEWRAADRLKKQVWERADFFLDANDAARPLMIAGEVLRSSLARVVRQPFRLVPYFDPGPWGGHWMEEVCDLPKDKPNHAWCFDCVPEENSLVLGFGEKRFEIPAIDLVFSHPRELLGNPVHARFGAEFPIRFDLLDTMGGGNLSLQVHPLTEYIQEEFGMHYTQDESYYMLDAGSDAKVYLGLREGIDPDAMAADLRKAQEGDVEFAAARYVEQWPAKRHDHFLIPAGTVHCSGKDSMVLEISATPYIFTFKLWDWGRLGLDDRPRPIHIEHGLANIQWNRTTKWTRSNLVNQTRPVAEGAGWRAERTGLHEREFIDVIRYWFTGTAPLATGKSVQVLNLVQGEEAVVESPSGAFAPFHLHYAETMIVPAAVGAWTIRPAGKAEGTECAIVVASVRTGEECR
ncbi:MAG TPA: class I mannose-6-phosphate isomerase [Terracidiphilus sp.]|nr:class I mannose-6-phosphate isomerase [Terracidiphilus sp.]HVC45951.1 class I mannose-6-phosphate isomerase [Terracidiphilus sp.]